MESHLRCIGVLLIVLAIMHVGFPRYFKWGSELKPLSLINRQLMYVHTLFIALGVLLMGLLCLAGASELVHTPLGKQVSLGFGLFWLARLLTQFFGYSAELWRGKSFETTVHVVFCLLWGYVSGIFLLIYCQ